MRGVARIALASGLGACAPEADEAEEELAATEERHVWEIGPDAYAIPVAHTTYACFGMTVPLSALAHAVRFEARIDAAAHVHHMMLGWSKEPIDFIEPCHPSPPDTHVLWGWGPGAHPVVLPEDVGFLLGHEGPEVHLVVQIHYDNPLARSGVVDSTKVAIDYTYDLRAHDAGVALLGDVDGLAIPAGQPAFETIHRCSGPWTDLLLSAPIHVFGSWLHAHELGRTLWTDLVRADGTRDALGRRDPYAFDGQFFEPLDVVVAPGDSMITHCIYDSTSRTEPTLGGAASTEEMCLNYLLYYPRQPIFVYCNDP